jgi:hypothetical protein
MQDLGTQFRQAEERFRQLSQGLQAGRITPDGYRAALNQLRITDTMGRLWMMQEGTGAWYVWQGGAWQAASPYGTPAPAAPAYTAAPAATATVAPDPEVKQKSLAGIMFKYALICGLIFGAIGVGIMIFADQGPEVLLGAAAAAALSWILAVSSAASHWEGQIVDIRTERVRVEDSDDDYHYENQTFAYLQLTTGKRRKMRAARDWQVGDHIRKVRGETSARKVG